VLVAKQLVQEQIAQSLSSIEAHTGAILVHTTALLLIVVVLAFLGLGYLAWRKPK
jgi:hypothetical protein